jgi:hypothetical protein
MKQTISYADLQGYEKRRKALQDVLHYLNSYELYKKAVEYVKSCNKEAQVHFGLNFIGIQGYPVVAMYERYKERQAI